MQHDQLVQNIEGNSQNSKKNIWHKRQFARDLVECLGYDVENVFKLTSRK